MKLDFDVDIDVPDREKVLALFPNHINASILKNGVLSKHNTGAYFMQIPNNPACNLSTLDYKQAEQRGYIKLDLLNMSVYEQVNDETHLVKLMMTEPEWDRLADKKFTEQLVHIGNYYDTVREKMPDSIKKMALLLAAIRPAKKHLLNEPWEVMEKTMWDRPEDGQYYFKKSHSFGLATLVVINMNLLSGL